MFQNQNIRYLIALFPLTIIYNLVILIEEASDNMNRCKFESTLQRIMIFLIFSVYTRVLIDVTSKYVGITNQIGIVQRTFESALRLKMIDVSERSARVKLFID